jgi:protein-tyrosine phosphatase
MSNVPIFIKNIYIPVRLFLENYLVNLADNNDISQINDKLFVGNISTATNKEFLKENGITHIINILSQRFEPYPDDFEYLHIYAYDTVDWDLTYSFPITNLFIKDALKNGGKVYIHCMCGVSRSVSILLAYLMTNTTNSLESILNDVRSIRPIANPNKAFMKQLVDFRYNTVKSNQSNQNNQSSRNNSFSDPLLLNSSEDN